MTNRTETYQAYLLRFWRQDGAKPWRVTIQCVGGEQHHHFASVDEAITFILDQLEGVDLTIAGQSSALDDLPGNAN